MYLFQVCIFLKYIYEVDFCFCFVNMVYGVKIDGRK